MAVVLAGLRPLHVLNEEVSFETGPFVSTVFALLSEEFLLAHMCRSEFLVPSFRLW